MALDDQKPMDRKVNPKEAFIVRATDHMNALLESIGANEWQTFEKTIQGKVSDEEAADIDTATGFLKSAKNLQDQRSVFERAARRLPEIVQAQQTLERIAAQGDSGLTAGDNVLWAVKNLADAASNFATDEINAEAARAAGGRSEDELEAAKERASKMNIR